MQISKLIVQILKRLTVFNLNDLSVSRLIRTFS